MHASAGVASAPVARGGPDAADGGATGVVADVAGAAAAVATSWSAPDTAV
jgi:hypothetical protein